MATTIVLLRTRCFCEKLVEIPDDTNTWNIPLVPSFGRIAHVQHPSLDQIEPAAQVRSFRNTFKKERRYGVSVFVFEEV